MQLIDSIMPLTFKSRWCIAGGYAACPALARDIDVWVWGIANRDLAEARQAMLDSLARYKRLNTSSYGTVPYIFEEEVGARQDELPENATYAGLVINIRKVAVIYGRVGNHDVPPIHFMVCDADSPGMILDNFDISTHAVAVAHNGRVFKHPKFTHPGEHPVLLRVNPKTPARYARICQRFGHTPGEITLGAE